MSAPQLLGELTFPEVADALTRTRTVVLAAGSIEQHGPHLPLLSDYYQGDEFVRRTVARLAERGVEVLGGLCFPFAPAEDALSFAGTISVRNETYIALVTDVLESLYGHGFRFFPIVVSHEQTMGPLMAAVRVFNGEHGDAAAGVLTGWYLAGVTSVKDELCEGAQPARDGHAGELETSRVLASHGHLVRMDRAGCYYPPPREGRPLAYDAYPLAGGGVYRPLHRYERVGPDGYVGDASAATAQKGDRMIELGVEWVCDAIERHFV
jgi:creatinine amidohydrolase